MSDKQKISVDVVSDVVCPWCFLGQKRLERAMAMVPEVDFTIGWRPYQLDPDIPAEGRARGPYMAAKFPDPAQLEAAHQRLAELGRLEGIVYNFEGIAKVPNTLDAHRLIRWGASAPGGNLQHALSRRLFELYFQEGADVGDRAVLVEAAREAGMDDAVVETLLAGEADRQAVEEEIALARRMGVTGVPCFLIEGRYAVMGAQDAEALADAFRQVAGAKARGELDAPDDPVPS